MDTAPWLRRQGDQTNRWKSVTRLLVQCVCQNSVVPTRPRYGTRLAKCGPLSKGPELCSKGLLPQLPIYKAISNMLLVITQLYIHHRGPPCIQFMCILPKKNKQLATYQKAFSRKNKFSLEIVGFTTTVNWSNSDGWFTKKWWPPGKREIPNLVPASWLQVPAPFFSSFFNY